METASKSDNEYGTHANRLLKGRRVAAAATVLTLSLVVAKGLFGCLRGSPALLADAVHSAADTLAIFACWLGLKLADRLPTNRFPFGLYRAETLASLVVSAVILIVGIDLLIESGSGLVRDRVALPRSVDVLVVALGSALLSFGIFKWEKRVGTELNSQSLLANADESQADILTSLAVFVGTGASYLGIPRVELLVALGLSGLIVWLGVKHGRAAVYALLDASLDPEMERRVEEIAERTPGVEGVEKVRLRRAGPFCFGIAHVQVRKSTDVTRAHEVAHQVVKAVREGMPQVESLTVHLEPFRPEHQTVMVPADDDSLNAAVSEHFGRARFFAFADVSGEGVQNAEFVENIFRKKTARVGLDIIRKTLQNRRVDAALTREIGEIAFHALRDHYVEVYAAGEGTVCQALARFVDQGLPAVVRPTHVSEAAGAPKKDGDAGVAPHSRM